VEETIFFGNESRDFCRSYLAIAVSFLWTNFKIPKVAPEAVAIKITKNRRKNKEFLTKFIPVYSTRKNTT
jgi:hypothetical protein